MCVSLPRSDVTTMPFFGVVHQQESMPGTVVTSVLEAFSGMPTSGIFDGRSGMQAFSDMPTSDIVDGDEQIITLASGESFDRGPIFDA